MPVCAHLTATYALIDPVFDKIHNRYGFIQVRWDRGRRVKGNLIYIMLHDGNIYIEYDGIEHDIADDLIKNRIPENRIVLAYLPEIAS